MTAEPLDPQRIVSVHKADDYAVYNLQQASEAQVLAVVEDLFEWTQDGNWPLARDVGAVLARHFPATRPVLLRILQGSDAQWKYFVMSLVALPVLEAHTDAELVQELRRIAQMPTPTEQQEEAHDQARYVLDELGL